MPNVILQQYPVLKNWPTEAGRKPALTQLKQAATVARSGTKDALAIAMMLRDDGATQKQIIAALGQPHRNKPTALVLNGKAKRLPHPPKDGVTVYRLDLKK